MYMVCMQSRGADPTIKTDDYDPYLNPGPKTPLEVRMLGHHCRSERNLTKIVGLRQSLTSNGVIHVAPA